MRTWSQDQQNGIVERGGSVHRTRERPKLRILIDNSNGNLSEYVDLTDQQPTPLNQLGDGDTSPGRSSSFQGPNQDTEWILVEEDEPQPVQESWEGSRPAMGVEEMSQDIRIASSVQGNLEEWTPTLHGTSKRRAASPTKCIDEAEN